MNASVQNLEEAANIASEFIYSVDNLPHEVTHLLQEIKHKETRAQELQQEIDKDAAKYIRHSLRASSSIPSSPSSRAPSPKSSLLPAKITASYAEIHQLSADKCMLAQVLIDLVTRTRARLDCDLAKVRILQGEAVESSGVGAAGGAISAVPGAGVPADAYAAPGSRNPGLSVTESLRHALANSSPTLADVKQAVPTPPASATAPPAAAAPNKRRRLGTTSSVKLSPASSPTKHRSASPTTTAPLTTHSHQRSRLSRQSYPHNNDTDLDDGDDDAEGEDGEGDDERPYCFCQKQSYGDMIACDNEGGCPFEWFHLSCVGMKQPTPEKWYCAVCSKSMNGGTTVGRKGRKK